MAGPTLTVLFRATATASWRTVIAAIDEMRMVHHGAHDFEKEGQPFLISPDDELPWTTGQFENRCEAQDAYESHFGIRPDAGVSVAAMSNTPGSHRILAAIALGYAHRLGGIIDLHGLIMPRHVFTAGVAAEPDWPTIRSRVDAFTAELPGKAVAVSYETASGRCWASHTVDAAFLRAWLLHPEFHLVK